MQSEPVEPEQQARERAVSIVVREIEQHVAAAGWDAPTRLFALVRTADALRKDPGLATQLPVEVVAAARADPEHLTAVEQEDLPERSSLEALLGRIAWPSTVDGAAIVVERLVVPPEAEAAVQAQAAEEGLDEQAVLRRLAEHPQRAEVRVAAAVLRGGGHMCALRSRAHDRDDQVGLGPDLVPGLVEALTATLTG